MCYSIYFAHISTQLNIFLITNFSPAGWDSSKKIAILHENMHSMKPDQYYTDVIARPMTGIRGIHGKVANEKPRHEIEITAEDEQQFLLRQQQYLQQGAQPGMVPVGGVPGGSMGAGIPKTPDRKSMGSPGVQGSPTKKVILKIESMTTNHYSCDTLTARRQSI